MPVKSVNNESISGLNEADVPSLQEKFGHNVFQLESSRRLPGILKDVVVEPMFILLFLATCLYFLLGKIDEGLMMVVAIAFVAGISIYQETKSTKALEALRRYAEPRVVVVRDGIEKPIDSFDLVPGDVMVLAEGNKVPADAVILKQNDVTVNESIITGESLPVEKTDTGDSHLLFQGSTMNSGQCYARVTAIGRNTVLGKLGKTVSSYRPQRTLLQIQIGRFVKQFSLFGFAAFAIILLLNYLNSRDAVSSLLYALTLAMAVIPEEIPVAFSSFMALGAFHMARLGIISRQPQTVENLGAVSVICLDKTGTITRNEMQVKTLYDHHSNTLIDLEETKSFQTDVLRYAAMASEVNPFDSMEKAIWEAYRSQTCNSRHPIFNLIYEYPLEGRPPMMTHVFDYNNEKVAAAKGAVEKILTVCGLAPEEKEGIEIKARLFAQKGFRVLGVASSIVHDDQLPATQEDFNWKFEGLVSLYDPPRKEIAQVFRRLYDAKISVKLVTGDFPETAINIAEQVGLAGHDQFCTGNQVMAMDDNELRKKVATINVFARMFPEAKLKVVEALKARGEIVAMTGDGVNDAPALKAAQIGIAMGRTGTEIARQAADLIITNDDLSKIADAIEQGRKIFHNLKKAIRYIISIHIPIILTASLPLFFNWKYPNIFSPIHIIFLELIMGPTCSIFYQREPVEKDLMFHSPRSRKQGLFRFKEVLVSGVQGLVIALAVLGVYHYYMQAGHSLEETRTVVFTVLITSNIFLTFVNRSFSKTLLTTSRYKNNLALPVLVLSVFFLCSFLFIPAVRTLFELSPLPAPDFLMCLLISFAATAWFELYKLTS